MVLEGVKRMIIPERVLMVYKGKLYELHAGSYGRRCELHKKNGGECKGCSSGETFSMACGGMSKALNKGCFWHWRELK